ncbi:hypothetical protein [Mesobacillus zeae]|nr:hypothetical protein [Mesobacillus zeae]
MIQEEEKKFFIKELGRLIHDYEKCREQEFKQQIYEDIMLLISVLH